jgi:DNA-binding transcriptional ArsR family regulator
MPPYGPACPPYLPDCLLSRPAGFTSGFEEELDGVAHQAIDELEGELVRDGLADSAAWSLAARNPRRWLKAYVVALHRAWQAVKPLWEQAGPLLEREVERVGVALAHGALSDVIGGVIPRGKVQDDRWYVCDNDPPAIIGDGLVLQPMLIGPDARLVVEEHSAVTYLAYPLPGAHRLSARVDRSTRTTPLGELLGEPRADILRRLDEVHAAGQLAGKMLFTPSAITHHLIALERAGLITRERHGRHVLVRRSARGTALLHLYES